MRSFVHTIKMEDICYSCLSSGRKVMNIADTIYHSTYAQILSEISVYSNYEHCRLCWECVAVLRKWTAFKILTQKSYLQIVQCAQQDVPKLALAVTSRLQTKTVVSLSYTPDKLNDNDENHVKSESFDEQTSDNDNLLIGRKFNVDIVQEIKEEVEEHQPSIFVNDLMVQNLEDVVAWDQEMNVNLTKTKKTKRKKRKSPEPYKTESADEACPSPGNDFHFDGDYYVADGKSGEDDSGVEKLKKSRTKSKTKKKKKKTIDSFRTEFPTSSPSSTNDRNDLKIEESMECAKEFVCEECGEKFTEGTALEKHLNGHRVQNGVTKTAETIQNGTDEKPRCVECNKVFSSKKTYRYHMNTLHKGQNRYPCPRCGRVYKWKSNLGRHLRSHKAVDLDELYCHTCSRRFACVATYRQHLKLSRRHVPEASFAFVCNDCGKRFVNKTRLRDHIDWEHLNKVKFRCQICNKPFKCHTSLYVHTQNVHTHKEKNNLCHVCGKAYQNPAKLRYHVAALHSNSSAYSCKLCSANFGWYSSLYRHIRDIHCSTKSPPKRSKKPKRDDLQDAPSQPAV